MTQSVDQKASAAASATNEWLTAFQKALTARDAGAAAALFADESYWRDIVLVHLEHHHRRRGRGRRGPAEGHAR